MSVFLKHIPCEKCGSSDANSLFDDGHQHCFACGHHVHADSEFTATPARKKSMIEVKGEVKSISDRGITTATCQTYGVTQDGTCQYYPYANEEGAIIALKTRTVENKTFAIAGDWKSATLFGQNVFPKGGKTVTIHEGELDALAGFQMSGSKYPNVSIRNGAQAALKDVKQAYEWLSSFEEIYICFDADEPGQKAANEVAEILGNKCKIVKHLGSFKDACDYLKAGNTAEYVKRWWAAESWRPEGVVAASTLIESLQKPLTKAPVSWPWESLDKMLYGLRTSELVVLAAGSGLGKSTILRELVLHILKSTKDNVGLAFLEETPERTMRGLVGLEMGKKIHLPDAIYDPVEIQKAYDKYSLGDRVQLWNHFGSNEIETVLNRLRYFVKAIDCKWLVLDHLSILVSDQSVADERKALDLIMTKLRMFVQEVDCGLILVSHLSRPPGKSLEDGAATSLNMLRGSAAIAQLADVVIGAERNSQADDMRERNTTRVRVLKSRYTGYTGPACSLYYDDLTGRLHEMEDVL